MALALYTIIAASKETQTRPCWILESHSADGALKAAWRLRDSGEMPWLPAAAVLSVRKASRIERARLAQALKAKPIGGPLVGGDDAARRSQRLAAAFFDRLWRGLA